MQNCRAIAREVADLRTSLDAAVSLVLSTERWNPVAAVVLTDLRLPSGIHPGSATVRIALPNLYGFAASASVVLLDHMLETTETGKSRAVPFCAALTAALAREHAAALVELRMQPNGGGFFLCLTPDPPPRPYSTTSRFPSSSMRS